VVLFGKAVVLALLNHIAGVCSSAASATYTSRATGDLVRNDALALDNMKPAFRENNVDESVLPNLTAEDLKDLGIATVGHRQKLLGAIPAGP
jgi:hypothetical protein